MIGVVLGFVLCFGGVGAAAACSITAEDVSAQVSHALGGVAVAQSALTDPDSGEPIRRYVASMPDGNVVVLDQKHCEIHNLSATVLSVAPVPDAETLGVLVAAITATPEWADQMHGADLGPALEAAAARIGTAPMLSLTEWAETVNPTAEVLLFHSAATEAMPFVGITSLVIGIGGL